jgi:hypothetical protein
MAQVEREAAEKKIVDTVPEKIAAPVTVLSKKTVKVTSQRKINPLKTERQRFSSMKKLNKAQVKSYAVRMAEKEERDRMKNEEKELNELLKQEKADERRKAEQRKQQKEENEKKSMVVQKITNTKKLKKLTPKEMRHIMKM